MTKLETIRTLFHELKSSASVARVLGVTQETIERLLPEARKGPRTSPLKGRKTGPRPSDWNKPGPAPKTHCVHGHAFTPENTMIRENGTKNCRTCHNVRRRANDAKRDWSAECEKRKGRRKGNVNP